MFKLTGILLFYLLSTTVTFSADSTVSRTLEVSTYHCSGYIADQAGSGLYTYSELGLKSLSKEDLYGGFIGVANVDCIFGGYKYTDLEFFIGLNYSGWGKVSDYSYAYSVSPSLKHFSDYGQDRAGTGDEVWQKDWGSQLNAWVYIADEQNRPFRNLKMNIQYQTAFWSKREGTQIQEEFVTDKVNFKAVNRTYFKVQVENSAQVIPLGAISKLEPKIVLGYLRDVGNKKNMFEAGLGFGISFTKEGRYYEALNVQYRARFGEEFINNSRLDVIEIGLDPKNLIALLF
ncbi:hypothetical protein GW758_03590 [Candidatus Falkowbacteria bacterium]|nr:hypothetical protein [Candidatus Falkowbacteria bacterium]